MRKNRFGRDATLILAGWLTLAVTSITFGQTREALERPGATNDLAAQIENSLANLAVPDPSPIFVKTPDKTLLKAAQERMAHIAESQQSRARTITIDSNGAHAEFGKHKVNFDGNLKVSDAIETILPGGGRLRSHIVGLCYYDPESGETAMIAEVKDCSGEVLPDDTVLYRDAFDGIAADVAYVYTASSLEQNVIIRKRLPDPEKFGFSPDSVRFAVLTEFSECVQPRKISRRIDLSSHSVSFGKTRQAKKEFLEDETLYFGSMRMVEGKAFTLGDDQTSIPVGKRWLELEPGRWFLLESTPYSLLRPQLEALSAGLSPRKGRRTAKAENLKSLLRAQTAAAQMKPGKTEVKLALGKVDSTPGVVVDYLLANVPLLNIDFVGWGKSGFAAIGQTPWDVWNSYDCYQCASAGISDLYWSDWTQSSVGIIVSNALDVGYNPLCLDSMYQAFVYASSNTHAFVTITNLPPDVYDIFVYAARATDVGAPSIELKRNGVSVKQKNLTYWGSGWYSSAWEEGDQYVRFRNVAVTNQSLTLDSYPDAAGYATFSGIQIIPSSALPSENPSISNLINVNFAAYDTNKVGYAAVGRATNDFWNGYPYGYIYAFTMPNLKFSDQSSSTVGLTVLNAPGNWGDSLVTDPMLTSYKYPYNSGNITMTVTNLQAGNYDFYVYNHGSIHFGYNIIYDLWSGFVPYGTKATTLKGWGPTTNYWELGQQYVLYKNVAVSSNEPVTIHVKHGPDGYSYISGLQIVRTTDSVDSDEDGLPDAWEMKWFDNLYQDGSYDNDGDSANNLYEYQQGLDPVRYDSNGNGINDSQDYEFPWFDDSTPVGAYLYSNSESWNWVTNWYDGTGWNGSTLYPHSGSKMHVSANVQNAMHQHYFERSVEVTRTAPGDVLYAYVNIDPVNPPSEIMLQFYTMGSNGSYSWEHRAYWGADNIVTGVAGTASRYYMGELPPSGHWIRMAVPAVSVGLEGKIVEGMTFTLYGGRAAWDSAGRLRPSDLDSNGVADYLEDIDNDRLVDAWEIANFGDLNQSADDDFDHDGTSNLQEYQNGTDPNTIQFSILVTNNYISTMETTLQLQLDGGVPRYCTVLVDSTNFATANWSVYASAEVAANVGSVQGWHELRVGLKGSAPESTVTWVYKRLKLDTSPPKIVVKSPTNSTIDAPMIQLTGYSPEELDNISCDVSNALGVVTNQEVSITDRYHDSIAWEFTTNYFECFDISLTNGLNVIMVRAADLAGNITVTNFSYTLDYSGKTNPPAVQISWPQDGANVTGDSFTLDGLINDPTVTVTAQTVSPEGITNVINGLLERNGRFWVENIPLWSGTNTIALAVEDVVGNTTLTNISVVQSSMILSMNSVVPESDLWKSKIDLTGTISDATCAVWVNGVKGHNNGDGTWYANDVPTTSGGVASFIISAYGPSEQQPDGSYGN